jgi:MAP/microtubule affinity-regulating kinase
MSSREPITTKVNSKLRLRTYVSTLENLVNDNLLKLIPPTCDGTTYSIGSIIGKGSYATVR